MGLKKEEINLRKGYAYRLYMSGENQKSIARTVGITQATASKWAKEENWEERRKEQNTSTVSLANSLMAAAHKMSEQIVEYMNEDDVDIDKITKCSDNLVKIMASAERISKSVTRATIIDVIIALDRWLMQRSEYDKDLTAERLQMISEYHRKYIEHITKEELQ